MVSQRPLPGFFSTLRDSSDVRTHVPGDAAWASHGPVAHATWGALSGDGATTVLSRVRERAGDEPLTDEAIAGGLQTSPPALPGVLPPFAAVAGGVDGVALVSDWAGFRPLYAAADTQTLSTSALLAAWTSGAALDREALAVQSLLGWQLGQRTLFAGVSKLPPGATAELTSAGLTVDAPAPRPRLELPVEVAVQEAARILRRGMERLTDEHPDAVLQLSGGFDSRLLLSAIPAAKRRDVRAMTLGDDTDGDVIVARRIAEQEGLTHVVHPFSSLDAITPADAWARVVDAAMRLDGLSDPLALAALSFAEEGFEQGYRYSGVGGEVARGFYYFGRVRDRTYDREDARRLASWRMFVNEATESGMLSEEFEAWARPAAEAVVFDALQGGGREWYRATDHLFLHHRVQRWAGTNECAVWDRRVVVNPMLDEDFLRVVSAVAPRDKAHSRFFARLQMELDPGLGALALEGRPSPAVYAASGVRSGAQRLVTTGRKVRKKVAQRLTRGARPASGTDQLARAVVAHWRENPGILTDAPLLAEVLRPGWAEDVVAGTITPRASSIAFASNLIVAAGPRND